MSIVRVGLAETRNFAAGYDAIFGKKAAKTGTKKKATTKKSAGKTTKKKAKK